MNITGYIFVFYVSVEEISFVIATLLKLYNKLLSLS